MGRRWIAYGYERRATGSPDIGFAPICTRTIGPVYIVPAAATLPILLDPAGAARRAMWCIGQARRRTGQAKSARPEGFRRKSPAGASKRSTVSPIRSARFSYHRAIFARNAARADYENRA